MLKDKTQELKCLFGQHEYVVSSSMWCYAQCKHCGHIALTQHETPDFKNVDLYDIEQRVLAKIIKDQNETT